MTPHELSLWEHSGAEHGEVLERCCQQWGDSREGECFRSAHLIFRQRSLCGCVLIVLSDNIIISLSTTDAS